MKWLTPKAIRIIEEILEQERTVEIAIRNGRLVIWAVNSKKRYDEGITLR